MEDPDITEKILVNEYKYNEKYLLMDVFLPEDGDVSSLALYSLDTFSQVWVKRYQTSPFMINIGHELCLLKLQNTDESIRIIDKNGKEQKFSFYRRLRNFALTKDDTALISITYDDYRQFLHIHRLQNDTLQKISQTEIHDLVFSGLLDGVSHLQANNVNIFAYNTTSTQIFHCKLVLLDEEYEMRNWMTKEHVKDFILTNTHFACLVDDSFYVCDIRVGCVEEKIVVLNNFQNTNPSFALSYTGMIAWKGVNGVIFEQGESNIVCDERCSIFFSYDRLYVVCHDEDNPFLKVYTVKSPWHKKIVQNLLKHREEFNDSYVK